MRARDFLIVEMLENLFEVKLSPSNVKRLANEVKGAKVGIEYEMVVPNFSDSDEPEPDYDMDESAYDIDDICSFFEDTNDVDELRDDLTERFGLYRFTKIKEKWEEEGKEYFEKYVRDNVSEDVVSDYVNKEPDLLGDRVPDEDDWEKYIDDQWEEKGKVYDEALDEYRDEPENEDIVDEHDFLLSEGLNTMVDVEDKFGLTWPHYNTDDDNTMEGISSEISRYLGKKVVAEGNPFREYALTDDSSISKKEGEGGLELRGPPLPLNEALEDYKKIKKWAENRGCRTNSSTGLHMNVSVPDYDLDNLDYVKLAILLGDRYVLERFGRYGNEYAESALDIIDNMASSKSPEEIENILSKLKDNMNEIASKLLHTGDTKKYTSINTQNNNRVEFRSPGNDWLGEHADKIEDTLYRCVFALDAACDRDKYKKEYYKNVYKILKPKSPDDQMGLLAQYMAGDIGSATYARKISEKRTERFRRKMDINIIPEQGSDEGDFVVHYDDGSRQETFYIEKTNKIDTEGKAYAAAKKYRPMLFKDNGKYITVDSITFDDVKDMKVYRVYYGSGNVDKSFDIVARNEKEAKKLLPLLDYDTFSEYPNEKINYIQDNTNNVTSKRMMNSMLQGQNRRINIANDFYNRMHIWYGKQHINSPRIYAAAKNYNDALAIIKRVDPSFTTDGTSNKNTGYLQVSSNYPTEDEIKNIQDETEQLIKQRIEQEKAAANVDLSNNRMFSVYDAFGKHRYVTATSNDEAIDIARKIYKDYFRDVDHLGADYETTLDNIDTIRTYYIKQQTLLSSLTPTEEPTSDEYKLYRVSGNDNWTNVAARSVGEAKRIALTIYPSLGTRMEDMDVVLQQDYNSQTVSALRGLQQYRLDQINTRITSPTTQQEPETREYFVTNNRGLGTILVRATDIDSALDSAQRYNPDWIRQDLLARERYPRPQPNPINPNEGMDLYIVAEPGQGSSGIRIRANSEQHAIERVRNQFHVPDDTELVATLDRDT